MVRVPCSSFADRAVISRFGDDQRRRFGRLRLSRSVIDRRTFAPGPRPSARSSPTSRSPTTHAAAILPTDNSALPNTSDTKLSNPFTKMVMLPRSLFTKPGQLHLRLLLNTFP